MLSLYVPQGRRSARVMSKRRASLVINLDRKAKRLACLVVDSSIVELILDEDTPNPERCRVVWVGKAGSKQEGEVGLETV